MTQPSSGTNALPPSLSLLEAAEMLGMGRTLAYELHRAGQFPVPTYKVGRKIRVATTLVQQHMHAGKAA